MKNKKLLISFLSFLGVLSIAGISTFAYLLTNQKKSGSQDVSENPGLGGGINPIPGDNLKTELDYEHLGLINGNVIGSAQSASLQLGSLLPYINKTLFAGVYDASGALATSAPISPKSFQEEVLLGSLKENTTYTIKVMYLKHEIFKQEFTTKTLPKVAFTIPGKDFPQGKIDLSSLNSYVGENNASKLYISFKSDDESIYGSQIIPVENISSSNSFSVVLSNLTPGNVYRFKLVETGNGVISDVYVHPETFEIPTPSTPTAIHKATNNSVAISLYGMGDYANKTLTARYRIKILDAASPTAFVEKEYTIPNNGKFDFKFEDLAPNLEYEFQIGEKVIPVINPKTTASSNVSLKSDTSVDSGETDSAEVTDEKEETPVVPVFQPIELSGQTTFSTSHKPKVITQTLSLNSANVKLSRLNDFTGKRLVLEYQNLSNLIDTRRENVSIEQNDLSINLINLTPSSSYIVKLLDDKNNVILQDEFETFRPITKENFDSGINDTTALLKFSGGSSYKNQDLIINYKKISDQGVAKTQIVKVVSDDFEINLSNLEESQTYEWEITDVSGKKLLSNQLFKTTVKPVFDFEVIGNSVIFSFNKTLVEYSKNGIFFLKYWTTDETKAQKLDLALSLVGSGTVERALQNLEANTEYNFELFTFDGEFRRNISSSKFTTKEKLTRVFSVSDIGTDKAVVNFTNLSQYKGRTLWFNVTSEGKSKLFDFTPTLDSHNLELTSLIAGKEHSLKLYVPSKFVNPEDKNFLETSENFVGVINDEKTNSKFTTATLESGKKSAPIIDASEKKELDTSSSATEKAPFKFTNSYYSLSVKNLQSYVGKTLELKSWNQNEKESEARITEVVVPATWDWNSSIVNVKTELLKQNIKYSFKLQVKDEADSMLWEKNDVLIGSIEAPKLDIEFSDINDTSFNVTLKNYFGLNQKVMLRAKFLKGDSEFLDKYDRSQFSQYVKTPTSGENNGFSYVLDNASIEQNGGKITKTINFSDIKNSIATGINPNDIKYLQFFVTPEPKTGEAANNNYFYISPKEKLFKLPVFNKPTISLDSTTRTINSLKFNFSNFTEKALRLKYAVSGSFESNLSTDRWEDAGQVSFTNGASEKIVENLKSSTLYDFRLINESNEVVYEINNNSTKPGAFISLVPSVDSLKIDFYNPHLVNLSGKELQVIASKNANFSNSILGEGFSIPEEASLSTEGEHKVAWQRQAFRTEALEPNTKYYYKVVEKDNTQVVANLQGEFQTFSNYLLTARNITDSSVELSFDNINSTNDGYSILRTELYLVYSKNKDMSSPIEKRLTLGRNVDSTILVINGLEKNTKYYFQLKNKSEVPAASILNPRLEATRTEIQTLPFKATVKSQTTKAFVELTGVENQNYIIRYGLDSELNSISSKKTFDPTSKKLVFSIDLLTPDTHYKYEILDNGGKRVAFGLMYTKEELKVTDSALSSTTHKINFGYLGYSFKDGTLKIKYRAKSATETSWIEKKVILSTILTDYYLILDNLKPNTEYEYEVNYSFEGATDDLKDLIIKPKSSFTTLQELNLEVDKNKKDIISTVTSIGNFQNEYITITTLDEINATESNWKQKVQSSLKYINAVPQTKNSSSKLKSPWFELKSGAESGNNFKFKDEDTVPSKIKAYFFFQTDDKSKLRGIELEFQLEFNEIRVKVLKSKSQTITEENTIDKLIENLTFDSWTESTLQPALQPGLTRNGYARQVEQYISISGFKFIATRKSVSESDVDKNYNRLSLLATNVKKLDTSDEETNYFSVFASGEQKTREGELSLGNYDLPIGNILSSATQSLHSIGINSPSKLEDLFTKNDRFGLLISSDVSSDPLWFSKKDLNISKKYSINVEKEPLTQINFIWRNGNVFEGITLNIGINRDGVVTLTQLGSALRTQIKLGQKLQDLTWDSFKASANPIADYNEKMRSTSTGIGIQGLSLGVWETEKDPGLHYNLKTEEIKTGI